VVNKKSFSLKTLILIPVVISLFAIIACGSAAEPALQAPADAPKASSAQPTAVPQPKQEAADTTEARDKLVFVMAAEPGSLDPWDPNCNATLDTAVCNEIVNEPLTWITSDTFEVVTLSGVESWEQIGPKKWNFKLREGVSSTTVNRGTRKTLKQVWTRTETPRIHPKVTAIMVHYTVKSSIT